MSFRLVNLHILGIGPPKPAYTRIAKSYVLVAASTEKPPEPPVVYTPPERTKVAKSAVLTAADQSNVQIRLSKSFVLVAASTEKPPEPPTIYTPPDRTKVAKSAVLTAADQSNVQIRLSKSYVLVAASTEKPPEPPVIYTPPDRTKIAKSYVLVAADRKLSGYTKIAKSYVLVAADRAITGSTRVAKSYVLVAADRTLSGYTKISKSYVLVAGSEWPSFAGLENYSWFFNQDGHVFYVFQIGRQGTFIYDFTTQKWSQWKTAGTPIWEATNGIEYQGRIIAIKPKSAEIVEVVPSGDSDEGSKAVSRVTTAQIKMTGRDSVPLGCLYVDASNDAATPGLSPAIMSLRISDDGGYTWKNFGPVSVPLESHKPKTIAYRSLGLIRYPGKLIQVIDSGGPTRIAGIDVIMPQKSNPDAQ